MRRPCSGISPRLSASSPRLPYLHFTTPVDGCTHQDTLSFEKSHDNFRVIGVTNSSFNDEELQVSDVMNSQLLNFATKGSLISLLGREYLVDKNAKPATTLDEAKQAVVRVTSTTSTEGKNNVYVTLGYQYKWNDDDAFAITSVHLVAIDLDKGEVLLDRVEDTTRSVYHTFATEGNSQAQDNALTIYDVSLDFLHTLLNQLETDGKGKSGNKTNATMWY